MNKKIVTLDYLYRQRPSESLLEPKEQIFNPSL